MTSQEFGEYLREQVVGQDRALQALEDAYALMQAGFREPTKPVLSCMLLGPTGVGKTRTVEAVAKTLHGSPSMLVKVDCAEFQHSHEIAKLIGSPPGYLGHRETHPVLTQEALSRVTTLPGPKQEPGCPYSVVLFDEVEKASDALWALLLGVLDKATLTLGTNARVDFANSLIFLTSNVGAAELAGLAESRLGFVNRTVNQGEKLALSAARRKFPPEFLNRLDFMAVYEPLGREQLDTIFDREIARMLQGTEWKLRITQPAVKFVVEDGYDPRYGARHLQRSIRRNLLLPLARLAKVISHNVTMDLRDDQIVAHGSKGATV